MSRRNLLRSGQIRTAITLVVLGVAAIVAVTYSQVGLYGLNVVLRRGMTTWTDVTPTDARLPPAMRAALASPAPEAVSGGFEWRTLQPGLEIAELPVLTAGLEIDRILLIRLNTAHFNFEVHSRPAGDRDIDDWMRATGATVAVNGSYFDPRGLPATPVVSAGRSLGPATYDARHGAFVATNTSAGIQDLLKQDWKALLSGSANALASYPLLIAADGSTRTSHADHRWLANRSFIAEDRSGRVLIGTTKEAFFSLDRLAVFLRQTPLDLKLALNLDGGPPACQAVRSRDIHRSFCGRWETQVEAGHIRLLGTLVSGRSWGLPLVVVAKPRFGT